MGLARTKASRKGRVRRLGMSLSPFLHVDSAHAVYSVSSRSCRDRICSRCGLQDPLSRNTILPSCRTPLLTRVGTVLSIRHSNLRRPDMRVFLLQAGTLPTNSSHNTLLVA
jgi:hypothetical protein